MVPDTASMTKARDLLKIGAFAKLADTNLRTLRYYEEVGLLKPTARSSGGFRYYRETDLNRIKLIRHLQDLGLTLDEIRGLLKDRSMQEDRPKALVQVKETLTANKELLNSQMEGLCLQLNKIENALTKLADCEQCQVIPASDNNYCEPCNKTGLKLPELLSGLF